VRRSTVRGASDARRVQQVGRVRHEAQGAGRGGKRVHPVRLDGRSVESITETTSQISFFGNAIKKKNKANVIYVFIRPK
jgi:hypothetical protein